MNMSEEKQKRYLDQLTNNEKKSDSTGNQFPLFGQYQQASWKIVIDFYKHTCFWFRMFLTLQYVVVAKVHTYLNKHATKTWWFV